MGVFDRDSEEKHKLDYMSDVDEALHRRGHPWAFTLTAAIFVCFGITFLWAHFSEIDVITRGMGQIIPAQGIRPVQSVQGGTITEIHIKENDMVVEGQPVVSLSPDVAVHDLQELVNMDAEYTLSLIRLDAEEKGLAPVFTPEQEKESPAAVEAQRQIYRARSQQFQSEDTQLQAQIEARTAEANTARETMSSTRSRLQILQEEERIKRPLVGRSVTGLQYSELKQQIVAAEGELKSLAQTIARSESAIAAAVARQSNMKSERLAKIADERNNTRVAKNSVEEKIKTASEHVGRLELVSPVAGTVKRVLLKKGGVAKPAETIVEILPTEGALEIEAKFSPQDRGFLFVNQEAMIKVTAYDFSIYGGLEGKVTKISQDTIEDKRGTPWYEVRFLTKKNSLMYQGRELAILPGMTVSVDVKTDKKTVLEYVMGPVKRAMQNAMTEH